MINLEKLDKVSLDQYIQTIILISDFFEKDPTKIRTWIHTKNLNLGGLSPYQMIILNKFWLLKKFIETQLEENKRNEI